MKYKIYFYLASMLFILVGCRDEIEIYDPTVATGEEIPVEFVIDIQDYLPSTKGIANPKRKFTAGQNIDSQEGDVIHINAVFNLNSTSDKDQETRYGALKLTNSGWQPLGSNPLTWPNAAVSGNFTAYYIPVSNGVLPDNGASVVQRLDNIVPSNDPLKAEFVAKYYGEAIKLPFKHLCSYLSIVGMDDGVADQFMFSSQTSEGAYFNNAYRICLVNGELKFEFIKDTQGQNNTEYVYLTSDLTEIQYIDPGTQQTKSSLGVSYFLEPGYYGNFSLMYPRSSSTFYDYLKFNYDAENYTDAVKPQLEENTPYVLDITQSSGIVIDSPLDENPWDESEECYDIIVEDFLKAINKGTDYFNEKGTQILEATLGGGTRLLHNVDFHNESYVLFDDDFFSPDVVGGTIFDGGFHYIKNLGCPLFRYNYGTIQNLGIDGVNTIQPVISTQYTQTEENDIILKDNSRNGIICDWNRDAGVISNIRIKGDVTFNVMINNDADYEGLEVHNVGGLVGSNNNIVEKVDILSPQFNVTVSNYNDNGVEDSIVIAGLLVGQNTAFVSDVTLSTGSAVLTNNCTGSRATYNIGGGVGANSGYLEDLSLLNISVDCSQSSGIRAYVGGLAGSCSTESAGQESSSYESKAISCLVSGNVNAGVGVKDPINSLGTQLLTGGLVGSENVVSIVQCRAACAVSVPEFNLVENGVYATGGLFGSILKTDDTTLMQDLMAYGQSLAGPSSPDNNQYLGSFAGTLPIGQSWANFSDKNITVKEFTGINPIGGNWSGN